MLDLDPDTRITAEGALGHPYLAQYADPTDEPTSEPYDSSFEERDFDIPTWHSKFNDVKIHVGNTCRKICKQVLM